MDRRQAAGLIGSLSVLAVAGPALAQRPGRDQGKGEHREAAEHPRIAKAIDGLQDAIAYMQAAPHDFGGHKQAAIEASRAAINQLRLALAYRANHS